LVHLRDYFAMTKAQLALKQVSTAPHLVLLRSQQVL
jgi:hypothetical protein